MDRRTETEIAAWLDGELAPEDRARVGRLIETDPEARALAERLSRNDALLREAFAAPLQEPVPQRLASALRDPPAEPEGRVVRLADRRRTVWRPAAMAAGLALVVGFGAGAALNLGGGVETVGGLAVGAASDPIAAALETARSGEALADVRPLASFETDAQGVCREFETLGPGGAPAGQGLACRNAEHGWRVLVAADIGPEAAAEPDGAFAPAGGAATDATSSVLDALGAGPALTPEAERAAIERGWSR